MDYRDRKYYLVTLSYSSYKTRLNKFKQIAPSLKISAPYNHFKNGKSYDGANTVDLCNCCYYNYWQMLISCNKQESDLLEYELNKMLVKDKKYSYFIELHKNLCGQ